MKESQEAIDLIKKWEGCRLKSYHDVAGIYTIGYGSIFWKDGKKVQPNQIINLETAEDLLKWEVSKVVKRLNTYELEVNQNQFDAIVSFCYNIGTQGFKLSTLYKLIKGNPDNPQIESEFLKWNKARINGKLQPVTGLTNRRKDEASLYFKKLD